MTDWSLFVPAVALLAVVVVGLSRLSAGALREDGRLVPLSTEALLANLVVTQALVAAIVVGVAWRADVPAAAFGVGAAGLSTAVTAGLAAGLGVYVADEALARALDRYGVAYSEELRAALAPESLGGWIVLLGVALPLVAASEELLFRGALIGAVAAGTGLSPWALAVASSALFGLAHGAQGIGGELVTGALGFLLAALFVVTDSLLAVAVAHYAVDALEFLIHEGPRA